ncbi:hypothetical protein ANN_19839 [Periplaneta americana]|uniref:Uncharacterized protein n=1 Tax=Periplaneta americana TaxID=6978 RepID=A0ABQ8SC24_PERAM|nr:hypothetical protein ANN_19839 [Periplaneta americana]
MNPGCNTESYPAFARIGLRENSGKNLNQVTCPDRDSNSGHRVSRPDALTVIPQVVTSCKAGLNNFKEKLFRGRVSIPGPFAYRANALPTEPPQELYTTPSLPESQICIIHSLLESRFVGSWSKASCLGLALRNARWFEPSWGKKFSHEISASVWDRCPPSIVMHLGSYDSVDETGDSEMIFREMRSRIRHRFPDIRLTVGENLNQLAVSALRLVETIPLTPQDVARAVALIDDGRSLIYVAVTTGAPYTTVKVAVEKRRVTPEDLDLAEKGRQISARCVSQYIHALEIVQLNWPARSPDLNISGVRWVDASDVVILFRRPWVICGTPRGTG